MTDQITPADIQAMGDVLDRLTEQSDQLSVDAAIGLLDPLGDLIARAKKAASMVETQAKRTLEGAPRTIGSKVYAVKDTGKWRPSQPMLKKWVFGHVTRTSTGEKRRVTIADAVDQTIDLMYQLFVSPSQMPKQGGLDKLGLERKDFCEWEVTGTELKTMDIGGGDE